MEIRSVDFKVGLIFRDGKHLREAIREYVI